MSHSPFPSGLNTSKEDTAEGSILTDRYTSEDVFERIILAADEEMSKGIRELFFSSLAAGFAITLTVLLYASLIGSTGSKLLGSLLYPLGFIYIILGNYQLFTENTLPPVALVLERMASIPVLMFVWLIVLLGNVFGGFLGAITLAYTNVLNETARQAITTIGLQAFEYTPLTLFVKGAFAGLLVAGIVWLDYAARDTVSRLLLVYIAFISIPLGGLYHIVVTTTEMFFLTFTGQITLLAATNTVLLPVLLGNTLGGILLVTLVNYFQTPAYIQEDPERRLSWKDWLFSWDKGRAPAELKQRDS